METLNPEIGYKIESQNNHQEKDFQKTNQSECPTNTDISITQINNTIDQLSNEIKFLNLKRSNSLIHIPSYSTFLSNFYYI